MPRPELTGLPKDLGLEATKDDKTWESLLKPAFETHLSGKEPEHAFEGKGFDTHLGVKETERALEAKGFDTQSASTE